MRRSSSGWGALSAFCVVVCSSCSKSDPPAASPADAGADMDVSATTVDSDGGIAADAAMNGDARACVPPDVSNLKAPAWVPVTPLYQRVCTRAQVSGYLLECISATAGDPACDRFRAGPTTADGRCGACIDTRSAALRGPVFIVDGVAHLDVAGCIANAQGQAQTGTECATAFGLLDDCHAKVCTAECGTSTPACATTSNTGPCKPYADRTSCVIDAGPDAGNFGPCLEGKTFPQIYDALVTLWCGGAPTDAGKD